jgi:UPF0716 protein FxsA
MPLLLILLFPLAEIATFILVGRTIGIGPTLLLVIVSSALGAVMLRDAGVVTALKLQRRTGNPAAILAEGGTRMAAGLLLLIPGFLSDLAAAVVLIPPMRRLVSAGVSRRRAPTMETSASRSVVEGEFRRLDPKD